MDINQQLEYLNLSADVLTENDVIDNLVSDSKKLVSAKGIYNALNKLCSTISNDYTTCSFLDILMHKLSNEISTTYQKVGNYISSSVLNDLATKEYILKQGYISQHQSLADYYTKSNTSSDLQLKREFAALTQLLQYRLPISQFNSVISNYATISNLSEVSSDIMRSKYSMLSDYYSKNETSSKNELIFAFNNIYNVDETSSANEIYSEFLKYQPVGNYVSSPELDQYYKRCQTSSAIELSTQFLNYLSADQVYDRSSIIRMLREYAKITNVYDKNNIDLMLSQYIKSSETSTAVELDAAFAKCSKLSINVSSDAELSAEFEKYAHVDKVSSDAELSAEFEKYAKSSEVEESLSNFYKKDETSSAFEISVELSNYIKNGVTYTKDQLNSMLSVFAKADQISSAEMLSAEFEKYQLKGNYIVSGEISSNEQLSAEFAKCSKLSINVSSDAELSTEFKKYAKLSALDKFALSSDVSSAEELSTEFEKYQLSGNYAMSSDVSSAEELSTEFEKYAHADKVSSDAELSVEFEKYQLSGNYAMSSDVSSAEELSAEFEKYAKSSEVEESLSNFYKKDETSSAFEISAELSNYQHKGNYAISSDVSNISELSAEFEKYHYLSDFNEQIKLYALSSEVSNNLELSIKFDEISNLLLTKVDISGDSCISGNIDILSSLKVNLDLSSEFKNLKNLDPQIIFTDVLNHLSDIEYYKYVVHTLCEKTNEIIIYHKLSVDLAYNNIESLYRAVNDINKITKLPYVFPVSGLSTVLSSINCNIDALSAEISSDNLEQSLSTLSDKVLLNKRYIEYVKCIVDRVEEDYVKHNEISDIALSSDVSSIINDFAKQNDVSSAKELSDKFYQVDNDLSNKVLLSGDSCISGNIDILSSLVAHDISSAYLSVDFSNYINSSPQFLISSLVDLLKEDQSNIGKMYAVLNYLKYDSNLSIDELDLTLSSKDVVDKLYETINKICDITKIKKLSNDSNFYDYVNKINENINKLNIPVSSLNLQQSLRDIAQKVKVVNSKAECNYELINDINNNLYRSYPISQTSSAYELKNEFSKFQKVGNYALQSELSSYVKEKQLNQKYALLAGENTFRNTCNFTSEMIASYATFGELKINFGNLIDWRANKSLTNYLLVLQKPFILELVNRVNEIIIYCGTPTNKIKTFINVREKLIETTNFIIEYHRTGDTKLNRNSNYCEIWNKLNQILTRLFVDRGLSLQQFLQSYQLRNLLLAQFIYYQDIEMSILSNSVLSNRLEYLDISEELSNNIDTLSNELSDYAKYIDLTSHIRVFEDTVDALSADISTKLMLSDLYDLYNITTKISTDLSDCSKLSDTVVLSSKIDELSDILSNYSLLSDVAKLEQSLANYVKNDSIVNKLALSTYDDLSLDNKYEKLGNYVSCDEDITSMNFGKLLVSGYYEPDSNNEIQEFKFYVLTSIYDEPLV